MIRRFVNVVVESRKTGIHSLHRLDVAKHLLYPSTAEASRRAAAAATGGGGAPASMTEIETLPHLPEKTMSFRPANSFSLELLALVSPRTSEARILCTGSRAHAFLFDSDANACQHMPSLRDRKLRNPISFSVPRAGAGAEDEEDLYVMGARPWYDDQDPHAVRFEALELGGAHGEPRWVPLPPPHLARDDVGYGVRLPGYVCAHAVVGRTICVSSSDAGVAGTYCFDTATRRWGRAGGWALPFQGGAQYVPDRDLWVGFAPADVDGNHNLCAVSDLATHLTAHLLYDYDGAEQGGGPPRLVGEWRDDHLAVPQEWRCYAPPCLVSLGAGRFCVAKLFEVLRSPPPADDDDDGHCSCSWGYSDFDGYGGWQDEQQFSHRVAVFTGAELVDGDNGTMMPRIVPHKSVSYVLDDDDDAADIQCVL